MKNSDQALRTRAVVRMVIGAAAGGEESGVCDCGMDGEWTHRLVLRIPGAGVCGCVQARAENA
jgi:hypothetical protein